MRLQALMLVAALGLAGCSGDGGEGADGPEATGTETPDSAATEPEAEGTSAAAATVTAITPFPSALAFANLYIANAEGYFDEENLEVAIEVGDGSGATLQAVVAGQADIGITSPVPLMQAVESGRDVVSFYTDYHAPVHSLVTTPDSGVSSVEELAGASVGVGSLSGGEMPIVRAALVNADLQEGEDFQLLEVGSGGSAVSAFQNGDILAYGASYIDILIMELQGGLTLTELGSEDGFVPPGQHYYVAGTEIGEEQRDVVARFGRALANATAWMFDNPDEALEVVCGPDSVFPEECEDEEFAQAVFDEVMALFELPEDAGGMWGHTPTEKLETFASQMVEVEELNEVPDMGIIFDASLVDEFNTAQ